MGRGVRAKCRGGGPVGPALCRDGCRPGRPSGVPRAHLRKVFSGRNTTGGSRAKSAKRRAAASIGARTSSTPMVAQSAATPVHTAVARVLLSPCLVQAVAVSYGGTPRLSQQHAASRSLTRQRQEASARGVQGDYQIPMSGAAMPKDGRYVEKGSCMARLVWPEPPSPP
jgi:hypothetical protein